MKGLFTFIIIMVWVIVGLLNVLKKRAEMAEKSKPRQQPRPPVPPRPARPRPRTPAPPSVFTPKREESRPEARPLQQTMPAPRERQLPGHPTRRRMTAQPAQLFGPPPPDVFEAEERLEKRAGVRPVRRERPPEPPRVRRAERPRRPAGPPARPLRRREARQHFRFSDNPIINGIIFSELLGPPVAKRPFHRRRMF